MMEGYSREFHEAEATAAILAVMLWPAGAVVDAVTGVSLAAPAAAVVAFVYAGDGLQAFENWHSFNRGYLAAGLVFLGSTYLLRKTIEKKLDAEGNKVQATGKAYAQKYAGSTIKQWCADNGTTFIGKMVCTLNNKAITG